LAYRYDIKSTNLVRADFLDPQIPGCTADQFSLFDLSNTVSAVSMLARAAKPDFSKNQTIAIAHDQVYFPQSAAKIPLQHFETLLEQKRFSSSFCVLTYGNPVNHRVRVER